MESAGGWLEQFPELEGLDVEARGLLGEAQVVFFDPGQVAFRPGDSCQGYVLVLEGSIKVSQLSENGREVVLYRVEEGQACILTTACLLAHRSYASEGVAEDRVKAILLPVPRFFELLQVSETFRTFVFANFGERLVDLMALIDGLAFHRIDERLARLLVRRCDQELRVHETHKQLALELGTAREVVSRRLKDLEKRSLVQISRGQIQIADLAGLREIYRPG